jgi:hypothetical protein
MLACIVRHLIHNGLGMSSVISHQFPCPEEHVLQARDTMRSVVEPAAHTKMPRKRHDGLPPHSYAPIDPSQNPSMRCVVASLRRILIALADSAKLICVVVQNLPTHVSKMCRVITPKSKLFKSVIHRW